ncbi:MAG TPA: WD40 repeat domain-containing protein [Gaiellaceae bacterium]|nr:WD40 repeat domain-containing protein [Gaiellaceae bacterium]
MKSELERIEVPGEDGAQERTWTVVREALAERAPVPPTSRWPRVATVAVLLSALVAAAFSSPGRAVLSEIREVVGVKRAQPALFSLPAPGRLLVASDAGVWVVQQDGSKRLLGDYREASWSPFGRFVVATRANELAALETDGDVRWTLARRGVRSPCWAGTETDTRIAYIDRTGIRVVAGDGTGDRLLVRGARGPLAWRPGERFVLAHATPRSVRVLDAETGRVLWQAARPAGRASRVEWSSDGRHLLVLSPLELRVYNPPGDVVDQEDPAEGGPDVAAAFRPRSSEVAVARVHSSQSTAYVLGGRTLFNGTGIFREIAWSPDGRWLLVTWRTADQWVFVRADGKRIRAVASVSHQFRSRSFPRIEGWCCAR